MVDVRFLFKQMPGNRSLTRSWLVEIKTDRALMTGTPQHSLHATVQQRSVEGSLQVEPLHSSITYGRWTFFIQRF